MLPTLPPHLLPGMLPVAQFNPFLNFPGMVPMITPPFLPVPPMFNMQMNLMKTMAMQAMTSRLQVNAPPFANFTRDVPMVPFPEAMRKVSSNQIKTIPSVGQPKLENQKDRKVNYMKKLSDAFMSSNIENRTILLEENENDEMPILIPIVPSSEATKTVSTNQIDTIPLTVRKYSLNRRQKKKNYIKKPLNAFMLFIKENRKTVLEENECDQLSAGEINKELGGRWKKLTDEERRKYFELAKIERELHKEKYPEWSAKDNYAKNTKKAEKQIHDPTQYHLEMCRARFGIDNMSKWCKYCLQKKRCIFSRVLSEIIQTNEEEIASKSSLGSTETPSPSATTPTDLFLDQASPTRQSREESLQTCLSTNSEAEKEGS